jgi:hypothetical protein
LGVGFSQPVTADPGAFVLAGRNGVASGVTVTATPSADGRSFALSFSGPGLVGGSLPDGVYDLTVVAGKIHSSASTTAAAAGGFRAAAAGPAMTTDATLTFHRLFSDADGDGDSDNADLFQVRSTYNKPNTDPAFKPQFDYDGDGDVDNADLFQVRSRRGVTFKGY